MSKDPLYDALAKSVGMTSQDAPPQVLGWVDTGNYALNWAVSGRFIGRGWPLGAVVEVMGDPATGKSYLLARAIAAVQEQDGVAILDDSENRFSTEWARTKLGVDTDRLIRPGKSSDTVEEHWRMVSAMLAAYDKAKDPRAVLVALDSLGILSTDKELEGEMEVTDMTRAKQLRKMFRLLTAKTKGRPYLWICANHTYTKVGASPWESQKESSGGGGAKYQATVRVDLGYAGKIASKDEEDVAGVIVRARVVKNSVTVPFRQAEFTIPFDRPIDPASGLVDKLLGLGYLGTTSGHNLTWQDEDTGIKANKSEGKGHMGRVARDESAAELLEKYPDLLAAVDADLAAREAAA